MTAPEIVNLPTALTGETASTAVAAQARAVIEARYIMAERHPRDIDAARQNMLKECQRPGFAKVARYHKPIGAGVEGPSIRFAETAIRCMRNIMPDCATLYDDREKRILKITVTDLEANVAYSQDITVSKTVERKSKSGYTVISERLNSKKEQLYIVEATDDDILNKQNALISKALRTLGLRLIPGDILDECMAEVKKTLAAKDAADPDAARKEIFDGFAVLNVTAEALKEYMGHDCKVMTPAELDGLRKLWATLRDGETTWREILDEKNGEKKPREPITQPQERTAPPPANQPATAPAPTDDDVKAKSFQSEIDEMQAGKNAAPPDDTATTATGFLTVGQVLASKKTVFDITGYLIKWNHTGVGLKGEKTWYKMADDNGDMLDISAFGSPLDGIAENCRINFVAVEKATGKDGKTYYNARKDNMQVIG